MDRWGLSPEQWKQTESMANDPSTSPAMKADYQAALADRAQVQKDSEEQAALTRALTELTLALKTGTLKVESVTTPAAAHADHSGRMPASRPK